MALSDTEARVARWLNNPWLLAQPPFRVLENVYYVGTSWVSCFLLDTQEGLVLIDCAMQETLYMLIDSIRQLGFDPHRIKKLLLTHGHFDHCGAARAIQEMSGCEIWIGQGDAFFFTERRDLIVNEDRVPAFQIDRFYDYDSEIDLGDVKLKPVHCPGHTPGTTSFFFKIRHRDRSLTCAIHGGLGAVVLSKENLRRSRLPLETRDIYCQSIDKVIDARVDVVLPSHVGHCVEHDFFGIARRDDGSGDGFVEPTAWKRMLTQKKAEVLELIRSGK
ncbi:MAG: MBL fold metallo-hydrolase [Lawsonibacter sp.]|nr:MBL fold metallo-hydrolase [Lawsonibacter sp.]